MASLSSSAPAWDWVTPSAAEGQHAQYQIKNTCVKMNHMDVARVAKALRGPVCLGMLDIVSPGGSRCQLPDPASRGGLGADALIT